MKKATKKLRDSIPKLEGWMDMTSLAKIWGVTNAHISNMVQDGRIAGVKRIGNQLVFPVTVKYPEPKESSNFDAAKERKKERDRALREART